MRRGSYRNLMIALVVCVASMLLISTAPVKPVRAALPTPQSIEIAADLDAFVTDKSGFTDRNYGGDPELEVGYYTESEFSDHYCSLVQFDIGLLPPDSDIISAKLNLTLKSGGGEDVRVVRINSAWTERGVTWDTRPSLVTTDTEIWPIGTTALSVQTIDVTAWVDNWFSEVYGNYGLWIEPYPWTETGQISIFYSYDGAVLDPSPATRWLKMPKLKITFESATIVEQPPPPEPPPWLDDFTPPDAEITLDPSEDISPDDEVTITVVATDDICLDQVALMINGVTVDQVLIDFDILDQTEVTLTYTTYLEFGDHHILASAMDRVALTGGEYLLEHVGSQTPPTLSISCSPEQVLPEDGSDISITVTAEDSEGLKRVVVGLEAAVWDPELYPEHSEVFVFSEPYPKSFTTTVNLPNVDVPGYGTSQINATKVECLVYARDIEELYSVATDNVSVVRPYQWDYGIVYPNPSCSLSWTRYEDTFGHGELWGPGSLEWWKTAVARFWWPIYRVMAQMGECFGMSMYSLWHQRNGIPVPDSLDEHVGDELPPYLPGYNEQLYAKRTIERWQGAQISQEILSKYIDQVEDQIGASNKIRPFLAGPFQDLREDLERGEPGILYMAEYRGFDDGVMECIGAHAVVPWLVVETAPNEWRIYVYDSNRPYASKEYSTEYDNFDHYPYVEVTEEGYTWNMGPDETWNDYIWYVSYESVAKTDYDLMDGWLVAATVLLMIVVVGTALAIASGVLITVSALLPIPLPLPMGGTAAQGIALPLGQPYDVEIRGQVDDEYSWSMAADHSTYSIANKSCTNGSIDDLGLGLGTDYKGYSMRFTPGVEDEDFEMGMSHRVGTEEREYLMENVSLGNDGDMQVYATEDGESMVVANRGSDPIEFKVLFRSNRSNGQAMDHVNVPAGKQAIITVDWNDLANASVEVETQDISEEKAFPYTIVLVIGLAIILLAVVSLVFLRRKKEA